MNRQVSSFFIDGNLYGIDVNQVQEITRPMPTTKVPLTPNYIKGLINLRGQVATAIGLREFFRLKPAETDIVHANVVCRVDGNLISFLVDEISDVRDLEENQYDDLPDNLDEHISNFLVGVYKLPDQLISILDIKKIIDFINKKEGSYE